MPKCESCQKEFETNKKSYYKHRFCSQLCQKRVWEKRVYYPKNLQRLREEGRAYYKKNRERQLKYYKNYLKVLRKKIEVLLGNKCSICGSSKRLCCHEIHGKSHRSNPNPIYIVNHYKDFVRLCSHCHRAIHWFPKNNRSQFFKLLKELQ